jgi:hypothetical protein
MHIFVSKTACTELAELKSPILSSLVQIVSLPDCICRTVA